jgi:hypothetical protein
LLREIGERGVLVIKDVTSILSMNRDLRTQVLGALREIHDGSWVRKAGTDGGVSIPWEGRIVVIGRGARDSMPPLRLKIIDDLAAHPRAYTSDVRRRVNKPWNTVAREMEALHMLEVLEVEEAPYGDERTRWYYSLAAGIDPKTLDPKCLPEKSVPPPNPLEERGWRQR